MITRHRTAFIAAAAALVLCAGSAGLLLLLLPAPHGPLDYMVAGALATAIALGTFFAYVLARTPLARRTARSNATEATPVSRSRNTAR